MKAVALPSRRPLPAQYRERAAKGRLLGQLAFVAAVLVASAVSATSAETASAASSFNVASVRNFLPLAYQADWQNWAIEEDKRGMLYFANGTGVLEFAGTR